MMIFWCVFHRLKNIQVDLEFFESYHGNNACEKKLNVRSVSKLLGMQFFADPEIIILWICMNSLFYYGSLPQPYNGI
jgi:hypothetical protein